jgi:DNA polymerase-3 subunit beta
VDIEKAGSILVPADRLRDIVRESIDDTLTLELAGEMLEVRGQDSLFKIYTQDADAFPPIPRFEGKPDLEMPGSQLKQMIGQTVFAAAKESSRYAFNGVLLTCKGKQVGLVATDGRRLAQARGELNTAVKDEIRVIIPAKVMGLIDRLIDDPSEAVGIQVRENQILVRTPQAVLAGNLMEGQFPPFEDVIPKDCDRKMTAGTADFLSAVRRASLLINEESKGVKLKFGKTGLVLSSQSPGAGEATVNFPCKFDGGDIEIGFNAGFLVDALKVVDSDEISFDLTAPNRPGLIRGGANFLCVVMPVNLQ